jgi:hypothetical protein
MTVTHDSLYIGGEWPAPSTEQRMEAVNATTAEVLGSAGECALTSLTRSSIFGTTIVFPKRRRGDGGVP